MILNSKNKSCNKKMKHYDEFITIKGKAKQYFIKISFDDIKQKKQIKNYAELILITKVSKEEGYEV